VYYCVVVRTATADGGQNIREDDEENTTMLAVKLRLKLPQKCNRFRLT